MLKRILEVDLPPRQSAFLWGARQTGKSSYLKKRFKQSVLYDLLKSHELIRLSKEPGLLREEVLALDKKSLHHPIIIDEIQKVPELLNEIHWLIENTVAQFILCGSSARKLKTQSTNLLGGRAWIYHFYPLTSEEIPNFQLLRALQQGLIPTHYLANSQNINNHFQSYIDVYLTDEIRNEGLVRNLAGFARFLDVVGFSNAEMVNVTNIARDCGIDRSTVQGYFQILIDTSLGSYIYPFRKKIKRSLITAAPKFYLFDVGIANYLARQNIPALQGTAAGKAFEHFIFMELTAYIGITRKRIDITYWRSKSGLEVDFILGQAEFAIEVKISSTVHKEDLKGLLAFCEEHPSTKPIVVSQDSLPRKLIVNDVLNIDILPWKDFLTKLWSGQLIL